MGGNKEVVGGDRVVQVSWGNANLMPANTPEHLLPVGREAREAGSLQPHSRSIPDHLPVHRWQLGKTESGVCPSLPCSPNSRTGHSARSGVSAGEQSVSFPREEDSGPGAAGKVWGVVGGREEVPRPPGPGPLGRCVKEGDPHRAGVPQRSPVSALGVCYGNIQIIVLSSSALDSLPRKALTDRNHHCRRPQQFTSVRGFELLSEDQEL